MMRHRRLGARATVVTLALALLGLGSGWALAHTAKPSSRHCTTIDLGNRRRVQCLRRLTT